MATTRKRTLPSGKTVWQVDFHDAAGRRQRRQFDTKREADAHRIEVEGQVRSGTFRPDAARTTVQAAADLYLEDCWGRAERGERMTRHHLTTVDGIVANHVLHPQHGVGALALAQLSASKVIDFRDRLRAAGVSVQMTRKVLGTLKRILAHAIARDLVTFNAADGVAVIGRRDQGPKKVVPPSKDAFRKILAAAEEDLRMVVLFAGATGVRAGELWALRWKHVDFMAEEVTIETRVERYKAEDVTKTEAGSRTVPVGAAVMTLLKAWRLRSLHSRDEDLIFPNSVGGYVSHDNFSHREFRPLCRTAGVKAFNWHALRHFAISCWIEAGFSPKAVQTFAGHSSLEVTMDRYGHLFPSEDHKQGMDKIARALV
jgi:integrase